MAIRFKVSLCASLVSAVCMAVAVPEIYAAETVAMASNDLPTAKRGECYGRVSVPAQFKTDYVDVVVRDASQSFTITPAQFEAQERRIEVQPAYAKLTAVQPVFETVEQTLEVAPASTSWVRNKLDSNQVLSEGERRDLELSGINLSEVEPGTCLYEHYKPVTMKRVPQRVLVQEASEKLEVVPAKFGEDSDTVVVKPAYKRLIEVPAAFAKTTEQVMVTPATTEWQLGAGPIQKIDNLTGDIMCLVDVPAKYDTVDKEVLDTPALVTTVSEAADVKTVKIQKLVSDASEQRSPIEAKYDVIDKMRVAAEPSYKWLEKSKAIAARDGKATGRVACFKETPAQMAKYDREVVKRPGRFAREQVPSVFETLKVSNLVADARSVAVPVPGDSIKVERVTKIAESKMEWMPVLCDTNMTTEVITRLQRALAREGYEPGPVDGLLGRGTLDAIGKYQGDKKMSQGGLTMETLASLGVSL